MVDKNQEKITFNINIMDLAKIDYLVENGFYSNRSDFLRSSLRTQLAQHQIIISDEVVKEKIDVPSSSTAIKSFKGFGILHISKAELIQKSIASNAKVDILIFGSLFIAKDIDLDLFKSAVNSIKVYGVLKGPADVVKYIKSLE